jgi:plastocyanin
MHLATLQLVGILGAEKSRVPFYIAGGVLVAWALIVSLGLGLRRPEFPGNQAGERLVVAITAVLVLTTVAMAVVTSGTPAKATSATASGSTPSTAGGGSPPASAAAPGAPPASAPAPAAPAPAAPSRGTPPKATTGTPIPPSSPAAGTAASALMLAASPEGQLSFSTKQLSAKAGTVTITFTNKSSLEHNVTIAQGAAVLGATPTFGSGSRTLTLKLKPGTYTFYCSVPGHRQAGMEGTLAVS